MSNAGYNTCLTHVQPRPTGMMEGAVIREPHAAEECTADDGGLHQDQYAQCRAGVHACTHARAHARAHKMHDGCGQPGRSGFEPLSALKVPPPLVPTLCIPRYSAVTSMTSVPL